MKKVRLWFLKDKNMISLGKMYKIRKPDEFQYRKVIWESVLEEVGEYKYLRFVLSRNGKLESEIITVIQERWAVGRVWNVIRNRNLNMELNKDMRISVTVATFIHRWIVQEWNELLIGCNRNKRNGWIPT